jgi:hypothetical protein
MLVDWALMGMARATKAKAGKNFFITNSCKRKRNREGPEQTLTKTLDQSESFEIKRPGKPDVKKLFVRAHR